jgi:hypothetical protein
MAGSLAQTRPRVKGVDSLAQNGSQGVTLDSLAPIKLKILHIMDWKIELDFWSVLGLRFQGFLMAAVLETFDGAASWSSHEPELAAIADPGYSSMTGQATFPLPLGPMER